jgi:hypothetical protein
MSSYPVITYSYMSQSEMRIHNSFDGYARDLSNRKQDMLNEILNWRNSLIHQIESHAREQLRLDQEFQKQADCLHNTRNQFIDAARPHEQRGDDQQIRQLLQQCDALKVELGAFEFPERTLLFIQLMTEEQLARKKRNENNAQRIDDNKSKNITHGDDSANTTDLYGSSPSKLTPASPIQTK